LGKFGMTWEVLPYRLFASQDLRSIPLLHRQDRDVLTNREIQTLELIARGFTDRDIATALAISLSTAHKHRENLQHKLGLHKSAQLVIYYCEQFAELGGRQNLPGLLSERELEVICWFAEGLSDKQVARELGISDLTVRKHRGNMQSKLQVSNVCALLFAALAAGELALPLVRPVPRGPRAVPEHLLPWLLPAAHRQVACGLDKPAGGFLAH
jgi:DNA-binding NarL/FixJ family response regulator